MQYFPTPCLFLSRLSKYFTQYVIPKHSNLHSFTYGVTALKCATIIQVILTLLKGMDTVRHTDTYEERERERESWVMVLSLWYARKFEVHWLKGNLRGPLEKFVDWR